MESNRMGEGLARFDGARFGFRIVRLCRGYAEGKDFYAFVAIEPHNLAYFRQHYQDGVLSDFSVFGVELLRGWGEAPPQAIIDHVQNKYGIEFDVDGAYIESLAQMAVQQVEKGIFTPFPAEYSPVSARKAL